MSKVFFIGAGPGDPELLSIKAKKIIDKVPVIIYAGSLVNKEIFKDIKKEVEIYNSAYLNLDEVIEIIKKSITNNKDVARVHTGDPSIYGTIREQIDILERLNIDYEIIPGISSFLAAAASIKKEYTLPNVSQTLILTRMQGRTKVPDMESIRELSRHKASMVIFLSISMIEELVNELKFSYDENTPVCVIYKASWKDEKIIKGNLINIATLVKKENIRKTALILIGNFLGKEYEMSKLYDKNFTHEFRKGI